MKGQLKLAVGIVSIVFAVSYVAVSACSGGNSACENYCSMVAACEGSSGSEGSSGMSCVDSCGAELNSGSASGLDVFHCMADAANCDVFFACGGSGDDGASSASGAYGY